MTRMTIRPVWRLTLAHFLVNAVILGAGYYWLGIGESRALTLAWNGLLAVLLAVAISVTYGAALVFFGMGDFKQTKLAWTTSAKNLLPLFSALIAIGVLYWLLAMWREYSSHPAFNVASLLTLALRKPVPPESIERVFDAVLFVVRWAVLPVALLPMLAAISTRGWRGFASASVDFRRWWYWFATPLLLGCVLWAPLKVMDWKPHLGNFAQEMTSFVLRASLAYLLFGAGWLVLAFATWAGRPSLTQSNTADSP